MQLRRAVQELARRGGEARTAGSHPGWQLIVDGAVAAVPSSAGGLSVVRERSVVASMRRATAAVWDHARPFDGAHSPDVARRASEAIDNAIVRFLLDGLDDKAIARRLDISPRTCQRRIAELMDGLGARTRLQAGYRIGMWSRTSEERVALPLRPAPELISTS